MQNDILAQIAESFMLLQSHRNLLARVRHDPPAAFYDMRHTGAEMAGSILSLVREAHRKGVVDGDALKATIQLAKEWLTFDDELTEVLDTDLPERGLPNGMPLFD